MRRIVSVTPMPGLSVHVRLTDQSERDIDLTPYLWGPVFEPLLADRALFEAVFVDPVSKTIAWPNGADLDPDVLLGDAEPARRAPS
jgi:hypothetical protein